MSQNESTPFLVNDAKNLTLIDATRVVCWPNFDQTFETQVFGGFDSCRPKFFLDQTSFDRNVCCAKKKFGPEIFSSPKICLGSFFGTQIFLNPNF